MMLNRHRRQIHESASSSLSICQEFLHFHCFRTKMRVLANGFVVHQHTCPGTPGTSHWRVAVYWDLREKTTTTSRTIFFFLIRTVRRSVEMPPYLGSSTAGLSQTHRLSPHYPGTRTTSDSTNFHPERITATECVHTETWWPQHVPRMGLRAYRFHNSDFFASN